MLAGLRSRRGGATAASHALSVYYPFCLVDLIAVRETDDYADTGETLLVFIDADGCTVTVRISPHTLDVLRKRIPQPAERHSK